MTTPCTNKNEPREKPEKDTLHYQQIHQIHGKIFQASVINTHHKLRSSRKVEEGDMMKND